MAAGEQILDPVGARRVRQPLGEIPELPDPHEVAVPSVVDLPTELPVVQARRQVEHRPGRTRGPHTKLPPEVPTDERTAQVDPDPPRPPVLGRGHLERKLPVPVEAPQARGRPMAEDGRRPTRQQCPVRPVDGKARQVTNRIHAAIHRDQPADPDPVLDLLRGHPERDQLRPLDEPTLGPRNPIDRPVDRLIHEALRNWLWDLTPIVGVNAHNQLPRAGGGGGGGGGGTVRCGAVTVTVRAPHA